MDDFYRVTNPRSSKDIKVTHTDIKGNTTTETRKIQDSTLVKGDQNTFETAIRNRPEGQPGLVYKKDDGSYTANVFDIPSSVSMDAKTGKITITAPKAVLESSDFKNQYGDMSMLKQLAATYRANHDTKIQTNDGEYKTIPALVAEYDKGLKDMSSEVQKNLIRRDELAAYDERAKTFNDDQTRIASYSAINQGDIKASDTDRQYIPKWLLQSEKGKKITDLSSWDEASGTVERKDLLTWWNLGNFSRDEMNFLREQAKVNIEWGSWSDDDTYNYDEVDSNGNVLSTSKADNLSSKTEIAKTISFLRFITKQDPEGNFFEKAGNITESVGVNFAMMFSEATTGTLAAVETAAAFLTDNLDTWKGLTDLDQAMKNSTAYYNDAMSMASDSAAIIGQVAGIGGQILGHLYVGKVFSLAGAAVGAATSAAKGAITARVVDSATQPLTALAGKLFRGSVIGIEEYAQMSSALATGSKFMMSTLAAGGKIGKVFSDAVSIARAVKQTPLAGTAIDFLADTLVDAAISDPQAMRTLLADVRNGNVSKEDLSYAREQLIQNLQGWAIFRGAGLAMKGTLTHTTLGKAANLKISQFITKLDNWEYDVDQAIKTKILGKTVIESLNEKLAESTVGSAQFRRIQNKLNAAQNAKILRDFKETFASGKNWDKVLDKMKKNGMIKEKADLKGLKKWINEATIIQNNIRAWNNAIDNMQKGVMRENIKLLDKNQNPFTAQTNDELVDWSSKLRTLESNKSGLTYDEKHVSMSKESSNYMGYKQTRERASIMALDENLPESRRNQARRYVDFADKQIEELSGVLGPDITRQLDDGLPLYVNEYAALNDYASSYGYINSVEQTELEDMDLWETGYVRTQRVMDDTGVVITSETGARKTRSTLETEHYQFSKRDFTDFEQVRAQYRNRISEVAYQKKVLDIYMLNGNATVKAYLTAEETEQVRQLGKAKLEYQKEVAALAQSADAQFVTRTSRREKPISDATYEKTIYGLSYDDSQVILKDYADIESWRGNDLVDGYTGAAISQLDSDQKITYWELFTDQLNENALNYLNSRGITTIDDLDKVFSEEGTDFVAKLNQAYLMGEDTLRSSDVIAKIARNRYKNRADMIKDLKIARTKTVLSDYDGQLGHATGNSIANGIVDYSNNWIDDIVAKSDEQWAVKKTSAARASILGAEEDLTREYTILESISGNDSYKQSAYDLIDEQLRQEYGGADISPNDLTKIQDEAHRVFDATLEARLDTVKATLLESTTDEALRRDVFDEIKKLDQKVKDADSRISRSVKKQGVVDNIILSTDEQGRKVYYQVDPILASIYNKKQQLTAREAGGLAKANYAMSKMFRLGTTTANLTSQGNQFFKDTGNAIFVGGMWNTLKENADNFKDIFGEDVIEQLKSYDPYELKSIAKIAEDEGLSDVEALGRFEKGRASRIASESSEVELYRSFRETIYGGDTKMNLLQQMDNKAQEAVEWLDSHTNGYRERYLRKNVYMSNLNEWLSNGYSISQARTAAEFAARNATTNFGRTLYHLQNISESTPYFAAAINGTKSFWRMFELDPVGITGRFMGGLVLPIMYLTGLSLSNEKDAKIYKQLPEYARSGNLTFVTGGQVFNIPLPEQLADLVNPFRHFVEYTHDANRSTFWKLTMNDLLGLSPIDLQGFSSVDFNDITNDPTVLDLANRGFSRLFSQVAPVALKTAYIGLTGTDPYTGKKISGVTRFYYDEQTESVQMMDYTQNMAARTIASWFGSDNPAIIEKITSSIFGNTGSDVLGFIFGAFAAASGKDPYSGGDYSGEALLNQTVEQAATRLTAPVTGPDYDQVNSMWSQAIRQLTEQKQAIKNDKRVQAIQQQLATEKDPEKRKKLIAERQTYKDEFDQDVKNTVQNLVNRYGGTFDRHKLASVMALLNFNDDQGWASATNQSQELHSEIYYEGRDQAIQSLVDMGISGANDTSVFGYYTTSRDGETVLKYNTPLAILNAQNIWYGRNDIDAAAIKYTLEASVPNLNQERSDMWAKVKAAKSYDAKDKIREEWNEKILGGIMPYVADLSTDQILNNDAVIHYLEGYIQVPNWYEKVNNRYVSSGYDAKTGTYKLDKNKAFVESYLRTVLEKR